MSSIDRVLVDPKAEALDDALRAAVAAIEWDMRDQLDRLECDPDDAWNLLTDRLQTTPEGAHEWRLPGPGPNGVRAALLAVWWSDVLGRRHLRLLGGCRHRGMELPLPMPSPHRPELACVYPDVCAIATQHRRPRLMCVCECGACGPPDKLAWMGTTCGPCFDRDANDRPPPSVFEVAGPTALAFAPDGRLAVGGREGVSLWEPEDLSEKIQSWHLAPPDKIAFSPGGRYIGTMQRGESVIRIVEPGSNQAGVRRAAFAFAFAMEPGQFFAQFPPDQLLARCIREYSKWEYDDYVHDLWIETQPFRMPYSLRCYDLALSPTGRTLAASCGDQGICFWDAYSGEPRDRAEERGCIGPLVWSPDGTALACVVNTRFWKAILWDIHAHKRRAVIGGTDNLHSLCFTPDGRWLLTCEETAFRAWEVESGLERHSLSLTGSDRAVSMASAPDGRTVALAMRSGKVRLWPVEILLPEK